MNEDRVCRRCLLFESGREDVLADIRHHMEKIPDSDRCTDGIYRDRIAVCSACDHLVDGTCLRCGCYPEFRAAFLRQNCPAKKW